MVKMYLLFLQLLKAFEVFGHWKKLHATVWLGNKSRWKWLVENVSLSSQVMTCKIHRLWRCKLDWTASWLRIGQRLGFVNMEMNW